MAGLRQAAVVSAAHTLLAGAVAWFWLGLIGAERGLIEVMVCAAPAVLALGLGFTSQSDRRQYVARLLACSAMLPILLMFWASSQDPASSAVSGAASGTAPEAAAAASGWLAQPWLFFSVCALAHVLVFVVAIWWLAAAVTRIEAVAVDGKIGKFMLGQRLQSLSTAGVAMDVAAGAQADDWVVKIRLPAVEGRSHRVLLSIDEAAGQVMVRERLGLAGAAPKDANEASMRSLGDSPFDPSRPDAQAISGRSIQTTMIEPDKLAAAQLELSAATAHPVGAAPSEPEAIVTLLCALVTRSGYAWQPVLGRLS